MNWLYQHADVISALASGGMLFIWTFYAWLFYQEFRRQRGSQLFIHEAGAEDPNSTCMLVNLSKEPIHILCSMAALDNGMTVRLHDTEEDNTRGTIQRSKQGPLGMGQSLELGSFQRICKAMGLPREADDRDESEFEIRVAAIHGFRQWPIGAHRRFRMNHRNREIWPLQENTTQMHSKREAAEVREWILSCRDRDRQS
jgi:hypothetical protein